MRSPDVSQFPNIQALDVYATSLGKQLNSKVRQRYGYGFSIDYPHIRKYLHTISTQEYLKSQSLLTLHQFGRCFVPFHLEMLTIAGNLYEAARIF